MSASQLPSLGVEVLAPKKTQNRSGGGSRGAPLLPILLVTAAVLAASCADATNPPEPPPAPVPPNPTPPGPTPPNPTPGNAIPFAALASVNLGMTESEVVGILGPYHLKRTLVDDEVGEYDLRWENGTDDDGFVRPVEVRFDRAGVVISEPTFW